MVGPFLLEILDDSQQLGMHLAERHEERLDGGVGGDASTSRRVRLHPVDEHFQARFEMAQERLRLDWNPVCEGKSVLGAFHRHLKSPYWFFALLGL